jgi:hypothetical protein
MLFRSGVSQPVRKPLGLYRMLSHNGGTIDAIRELIAVPPKIEHALQAFAKVDTI